MLPIHIPTSQASQAARRNQSAKASASRARMRIQGDEFDALFGYARTVHDNHTIMPCMAWPPAADGRTKRYNHRYPRFKEAPPRVGWLLDMSATTVPDEEGKERSGLDLYFLQQDGDTFKVRTIVQYSNRRCGRLLLDQSRNQPNPIPMPVQVTSFYEPYFYLGLRDDRYTAEVTQLLQRKFDSVGASFLFHS